MSFARRDNSTAASDDASHLPLPSQSDLAVAGIPFQDGPEFSALRQFAGQLPILSDSDVMFFWLIANATNMENQDKLVIWLNGGPGCTSLDGVFMENGPYKFDGANRLRFREHSLSQQFDVLYIDQPFGTGFSVAKVKDYAHTFKEATSHLMSFLDKFYQVFPEYRSRKLYVAGESEAGTYIPYLADAILKMPDDERYDLGGIMLGNGWIDPFTMYMSYGEILRANNLLTDAVQKRLVKLMDTCAREFRRAPQPVHTDVCEAIPMVFLEEGGPSPGLCYNMYDLRLTDTQPSCGMNWPPEVGTFTAYLNRKDVQRALNVRSDRAPVVWKECSSATNSALRFDTSPPSVKLLPEVLAHVPVLFFVGEKDYLCNYIGIEWAIGNMTWGGDTGLSSDAVEAEWTVAGDKAGHVMSDRGLTYAKIYDASHMVGVDKPREILDLFTVFTNASSRNLRFTSSFRELEAPAAQPTAPKPPEKESTMGVPQWIGVGFALFLVMFLAIGLLRRKQMFNWWIDFRRRRMGMRRLDDVAEQFDRLSVDEDDAFAMSEFVFGKQVDDAYGDGLLLDDSMASSPDEDIGSTVHGGSSNHSPIRKNSAP
ncbi:Cell death protease [Coemansia interrupta]|uniref:Pheromone-processing carboxypeptidase KEX1 n=1 Tax=Coemansia interrupta TaxID=1126814 RepID=A0A9W8LJA8_9FUNG|nr:Cell death protease [Coemansia interrupta]